MATLPEDRRRDSPFGASQRWQWARQGCRRLWNSDPLDRADPWDSTSRATGDHKALPWSRFRKNQACHPPCAAWGRTCPPCHRLSVALRQWDISTTARTDEWMLRACPELQERRLPALRGAHVEKDTALGLAYINRFRSVRLERYRPPSGRSIACSPCILDCVI